MESDIDDITKVSNRHKEEYLKTESSKWAVLNIGNIVNTIYGGELKPIKRGKMEEVNDYTVNVQEQLTIENVDNTILANAVANNVGYEFANMILVKPMEIEKVTKTLTVPEDSGEKNEEGEPIMQMTIKDVVTESLLRKGTIISIPASLRVTEYKDGLLHLNIGDVIVFPNKRSIDFDLLKDSLLVPYYEVLARTV